MHRSAPYPDVALDALKPYIGESTLAARSLISASTLPGTATAFRVVVSV